MGEAHPRYKGGRTLNRRTGYVSLCIRGRTVMEHRYLMEQHLGRPLLPTERVHHIDGNKSNNDLSNLELCASAVDHQRRHHSKNWVSDTEYRCARCKVLKSFLDFHKRRSRPLGIQSWCKSCVSERDKSRPKRVYPARAKKTT